MGFTNKQKIILAVMSLSVLVVMGAFGIMLTRTLSSNTTPVITPIPWTPGGGNITTAIGDTTNITPTATLTPTPTPTPRPNVATRYDLQILRDPTNVDLLIARGNEYLQLQAYELALADFSYAQTLSPYEATTVLGQGQALFYLRRWQEAESAFKAAIALNYGLPEPHFWLGQFYYYQGKYRNAADEFDTAAEYNPAYVEAESWLAFAMLQLGDTTEAQAAVNRASLYATEQPVYHLAHAEWLIAICDPDEALSELTYVLNDTPHNFAALNALARFDTEVMPERLSEAEQLANQAFQWATWDLERAQALHTLARVYLLQERQEDAVEALNRAAEYAIVDETTVALPDLAADLEHVTNP